MEVSQVRRQLKAAIDTAREQAQLRRQRVALAELAYDAFLTNVATPVVRQLANALKVEGYTFTVFSPTGGVRLAADRGRDDFIDLALDTNAIVPQVVARVSYTRGSRTIDEEKPIKPGAAPDAITETDVLEFLLAALEPWLER